MRDCKHGTIGRRQLLQILGFGATAVVVGGTASRSAVAFGAGAGQAAGGSRVFPLTTVQHISYAVADYAKSRDFYVDLFGMTVAWDDGKGCAVEFGSDSAVYGMYIRSVAKPGDKAVVNHVAWGIQNFVAHKAALKAEMERRGLANIRPDGEHGWICDDPSGYALNIVAAERDEAMFPGAASPCAVAASAKCQEAYAAGLKNLVSAPKPSGKGFKAVACKLVFNVADVNKETEFYRDVFGVKVVSNDAQNGAVMTFGPNTLTVRKTTSPSGKGSCDHFAFVIENYNQAKVEAELKRRGLKPKADPSGFTFEDPDGFSIGVAKV